MEKEKLLERIKELKKENSSLKKLAYRDCLTGVYNRNWFFYGNAFDNKYKYLILADLNDLKKINDTYGHIKGDKFILKVVSVLKKYGEVVRFGGDEFIVLTKNAKDYELLCNLEEKDFCCGGVKIKDYENIEEAIEKADEILYKKKREFKIRHKK